jgi:hypothetical protein
MVMLFCALEGFIRDRSLECADAIDRSRVPYSHLPEGLKYSSLIATFEGLFSSSRGWAITDRLNAFEGAVVAAASGKLGAPYKFTEYSFAKDKSNVNSEDISTVAKRFGVASFWGEAKAMSQSVGMTITGNLDEAYRQLAQERHRAAHVAAHSVPHSDLNFSLSKALLVALTFDILLSAAVSALNKHNFTTSTAAPATKSSDVNFLFVRPHNGRWAAFAALSSGRAKFVELNREDALRRASIMAQTTGRSVIALSGAGGVDFWRSAIG